jgi:Tfp pilus assembly protein PilZ
MEVLIKVTLLMENEKVMVGTKIILINPSTKENLRMINSMGEANIHSQMANHS